MGHPLDDVAEADVLVGDEARKTHAMSRGLVLLIVALFASHDAELLLLREFMRL
jgi:hypothetical protein